MSFEAGKLEMEFDLVRDALSCADLMKIPNAASIYPDAYKRCQEAAERRGREPASGGEMP